MEHKATQNERIIDYIAEVGSITQIEALRDLSCMRLASRISDLRRLGYDIIAERVAIRNRYGEKCNITRYSLRGAENG